MPEEPGREAPGARRVSGLPETPGAGCVRASQLASGDSHLAPRDSHRAPRTATALLSVEHLTTVFDLPAGPAPAVIDVSFHVDAGETL